MNPNVSHPSYQAILECAAIRNPGEDVDMSAIDGVDPALLDAYQGNDRVLVTRAYPHGTSWTRGGRVGVLLEQSPVLLLFGLDGRSSGGLSVDDRVDAIWVGRYHSFTDATGPYNVRSAYVLALAAKRAQVQRLQQEV